ncbi:sigma 54-interacting transcriptional regulator [Sporomusa acidovorans]|uniref:Anaerobic nitric oxide reductase transcription regulator NorR n=1 Tax=Sporomusa acidovorans (strain ATCC 49682 / DSM 3132 / Mol) TaxID=1123286 RepID=A0ABZ3J841_SPOA4|nr:sigma 54-interacting transcriptional regulator [Sporomusa acidovorans]OZC21213.1 limonene hydroxylase [Sporomusa acidovorans DSM 3132]SDE64913.1 Transcriptional regulator containing PAS, AAA-type ATPase, and DNA-binding Fis domains [Sporomusa acidovorans]
MSEIVLIAPDPEIVELAETLGLNGGPVSFIAARLMEGVTAAKAAVSAGAKVLITRGLTFHMIINAIPDIAVVEISYTGYDILRARLAAANHGGYLAVVAVKQVTAGMKSIEDILQLPACIKVNLEDDADINAAIGTARQLGATTLIGTRAVIETAATYGLTGTILTSGREGVEQAILLAMQQLAQKRSQEQADRQLETIINSIDYGVLAIDHAGAVTAMNMEAARLFNLAKDGSAAAADSIIERLWNCMEKRERQIGIVEHIGRNFDIAASFQPVVASGEVVGAVTTFQLIDQLRELEWKTRQELALRGRIAKASFLDIESQAPAMQRVIEEAKRFACYDSTVLILGETGVGKEYFAQAIHQASSRSSGPFVAVNCAAIPANILESELFGYAEGAFTGAKKGGKIGLFEQAHEGTIFLDEIGEMSDALQARLLRVLQEHQVYRVGDDRVIPVNIRVIAATNRDLRQMMAEQCFRADCYYRLAVLTITLLPLRDRKADIPLFVRAFIADFNQRFHTAVQYIAPEGISLLAQYDWPGNIRELHNIVERLVVLAATPVITKEEVSACLKNLLPPLSPVPPVNLKNAETIAIQEALAKTGGNKQQAAKLLGIGRSTLWRKLRDCSE